MGTIRFGIYRSLNPDYTLGHRFLEMAGIAAFFVLNGLLVAWCWTQEQGLGTASLLLAALLGFIGADFISGFVHWMGDTLGDENTPLLGKAFIRPFREHHVDQKEITRHDFIETNGNNCLVCLPVLFGTYWLLPERHVPIVGFLVAALVSLTLSVFGTNQFHKWSHLDDPPPVIAFLQRWHLILNPTHHTIHHTPPFEKHYCITVGWLNPLLSGTGFWRFMERAVIKVGRGVVKVAVPPAAPAQLATDGA